MGPAGIGTLVILTQSLAHLKALIVEVEVFGEARLVLAFDIVKDKGAYLVLASWLFNFCNSAGPVR